MNDEKWQNRLLPWMLGFILAMTIVFFLASAYQLWRLEKQVEIEMPNVADLFTATGNAALGTKTQEFDYVRWKALVSLEADIIRLRYHQTNAAMMARVWTRYVGFMTGMILALAGAIFILGKLKESPTRLSGKTIGMSFNLGTSSPGIVLAVLGTVLMIVTLSVPFQIETRDVGVYLGSQTIVTKPPEAFPSQDLDKIPTSKPDVNKAESEIFEPENGQNSR